MYIGKADHRLHYIALWGTRPKWNMIKFPPLHNRQTMDPISHPINIMCAVQCLNQSIYFTKAGNKTRLF